MPTYANFSLLEMCKYISIWISCWYKLSTLPSLPFLHPWIPLPAPFQHLQPTALSCQKLPARIVQLRISNDKYTELPCKHLSYSSQKNILFKICTSSCNHCQTNLEQKINLGIFWGSKVWFNEYCETFPAILESKWGCLGTWVYSVKSR